MGSLPNFTSICLQPTEPLTAARQLSVVPQRLCVPRKAHSCLWPWASEGRGGPTAHVVQGFSLLPFPASCLGMDYRWSEKDFLAQQEGQSPGGGFITGCQFMPPQIGPGCRDLSREAGCLRGQKWRVRSGGSGDGVCGWRKGAAGKGCFHLCDTFPPVGLKLPPSKGAWPLGDAVAGD